MIMRDENNQKHPYLPERSNLLCRSAISTLYAVCNSISSGDILVQDLKLISRKRDQMETLLSAIKTGNLEKKGEEYNKIKMALDTRIKEQTMFINRHKLLGALCNGVIVPVAGE